MCYQLLELYSACRCFYYQHPIDRCAGYGRSGHGIERRTIYVGYSCGAHSNRPTTVNNPTQNPERQRSSQKARHPASLGVPRAFGVSLLDAATGRSSLEADENQPTTNRNADDGDHVDSLFDSSPNGSDSGTVTDASESFSDASLTTNTDTTGTDSTVEEELFHSLLYYQNLEHLWPQVVQLAGNRARLEIRRFLRRFGDDLAKVAPGKLEKRASGFVRKRALEVATRIWEAHCVLPTVTTEDGISDMPKDSHDPDEKDIMYDAELVDEWLDYRLLHDFLFETEPVVYLEKSVREWVLLAQPPVNMNLLRFVNRTVRNQWELILDKLGQTVAPMKTAKLEHKCRCGQTISDRYVELRPGAVEALKAQLLGYGAPSGVSEVTETVGSNANSPPQGQKASFKGLWKGSHLFARGQPAKSLPTHHSGRAALDRHACPQAPGSTTVPHNFVLLCLPFMRWATKLQQPEVCRLRSDQDFFRLLGSTYAAARATLSWPQLRRVSAIDFVRFEMFQNDLVDIQHKPSLPSEDRRADYEFEPLRDADTIPPVGPNLLLHYFEHPDHADVVPVLFRRVPKKLRGKLAICPVKRSSVGWGMQLAEGVSAWLLFWCGCAAFGVALAIAVGWSVARCDVQGGFAIAGFLVAFFMFCLGAGNLDPL